MTTTRIKTETVEIRGLLGPRTVTRTIMTGTIEAIQRGPQRAAGAPPLEGAADDTLTLTGGHVVDLGWAGLNRVVTDPDTFLLPPVEGVAERLIGQRVTVVIQEHQPHPSVHPATDTEEG